MRAWPACLRLSCKPAWVGSFAAALLGFSDWSRPERFQLYLDGSERFQAHAIGSAPRDDQPIAVTIESKHFDHPFSWVHEPNVLDALTGVDWQLVLAIDALGTR